jgi:hypothetical protein
MSVGLKGNADGSGAIQVGGTDAITLSTALDTTLAGSLNAPNTFAFKNRIINGAMVIDQRNAGASLTPTTGVYTVDRWQAQLSLPSKYSIQQNAGAVTPPAGYSNYLGVTSASAYSIGTGDYFGVSQFIEGLNTADLAWGTASAATVTLSFWVRSSLTGTFGGSLNNSAQNRSYPFSYTISAANTWEQKSVTIAGDTSGTWLTTNGIGIRLWLSFGVGSTYSSTAGAWAAGAYYSATGATSVVGTNGATFYITGVQLEKGRLATSFDYLDYGRSLAQCQRYYEKSYPQGTAVPTNATNAGYAVGTTTVAIANGSIYAQVKYSVTKRVLATINTYSYGSSTASTASNAAGTDLAASSATVTISSDSAFNVLNNSGANITPASGGFIFHWAASAEL